MNSAPQLAFANMSKPTFYKQRDNHLFPSWAYAVTHAVTQLPQSTVETIVFSLVCYWVSGWEHRVERPSQLLRPGSRSCSVVFTGGPQHSTTGGACASLTPLVCSSSHFARGKS